MEYSIAKRRTTTINHAFASAIAPVDIYDEERVREAIVLLEQNPDEELDCAYCESKAETWDHVFATVRQSMFSGHGHRLGNLLPCCKPCNSKKGNKDWLVFLRSQHGESHEYERRRRVIRAFLDRYLIVDPVHDSSEEYIELQLLRKEVLKIIGRADALAKIIRSQHLSANTKLLSKL